MLKEHLVMIAFQRSLWVLFSPFYCSGMPKYCRRTEYDAEREIVSRPFWEEADAFNIERIFTAP